MDNADTLILGNPTTVDDIRFDVDTYGEGAMMIKSSGQILIGTDTPRGLTTIEQGNEETTKSVKYSVLVPIMLKAIQELKAEVDKLKQECKCKN